MNIYDLEYLATLKSTSAPVVVLDRDTFDIGLDCITFDNMGTSFQLTQHLIQKGHKDIAFLGRVLPISLKDQRYYDPATSERLRGYRLALEAAGIPYERSLSHLRRTVTTSMQRHPFVRSSTRTSPLQPSSRNTTGAPSMRR